MGIENPDVLKDGPEEVRWPNQKPIVDGITPTDEVSQDATLFDHDEDLDREMD